MSPLRVLVGGHWQSVPSQAERDEETAAWRRRLAADRMTTREKQLAIIADFRKAADAAELAGDTDHAAELRRIAKQKEKTMPPDISIERVAQIRTAYTAKVTQIRGEMDALAADDGKEAAWKSRRRRELTDALDAARSLADAELSKWLAGANAKVQKQLGADTRTPDDVSRDMGAEMMATRLAKTVNGATEARNNLMPAANRLLEQGREREARAYLSAAVEHGVTEAAGMLGRLDTAYRNTWPGHAEAIAEAARIAAEVQSWQTERAATTAQIERSAISAARAAGDQVGAVTVGHAAAVSSIGAKLNAYRGSLAAGTDYADPVGPDTSPQVVQSHVTSDGSSVVR
jgi:hypothetical protein